MIKDVFKSVLTGIFVWILITAIVIFTGVGSKFIYIDF